MKMTVVETGKEPDDEAEDAADEEEDAEVGVFGDNAVGPIIFMDTLVTTKDKFEGGALMLHSSQKGKLLPVDGGVYVGAGTPELPLTTVVS
jgi:hypothetical protein